MASAPKIKEWPRKLNLRDGTPADYLGVCPISGRHRVRFVRGHCPTLTNGPNPRLNLDWSLVYTLDDNGVCRCDQQPGPMDYDPQVAS